MKFWSKGIIDKVLLLKQSKTNTSVDHINFRCDIDTKDTSETFL